MHQRNRNIRTPLAVIVFLAVIGSTILGGDSPKKVDRKTSVKDRIRDSIVNIIVKFDAEGIKTGTGFIVADGYVLTNAHVVDTKAAKEIYIINEAIPKTPVEIVAKSAAYDDNTGDFKLAESITKALILNVFKKGINISYDDAVVAHDFALLRYDPNKIQFPPPLTFNAQVGQLERIFAWGYPISLFGLDRSSDLYARFNQETPRQLVPTDGMVSIIEGHNPTLIVHTALTAGGNSGGPLVNQLGEVVGVNTIVINDDQTRQGSAYVSGALSATDAVTFLRSNGIEPQISGEIPNTTPSDAKKDKLEVKSDSEARRMLLRSATRGDADCQALIGFLHYIGAAGFTISKDNAFYWLEKASTSDDPIGRFVKTALSVLYLTEPAYRNPRLAINLFYKATTGEQWYLNKQVTVELYTMMAEFLYQGEYVGINYSPEDSFKLASKAHEEGSVTSSAIIGFHYYFGDGVVKDHYLALDLARKASGSNVSHGDVLLAWLYYSGDVVEANVDMAYSLASEHAENGNAWAQGLLACIYYDNNDLGMAAHWAEKAAEKTNRFGQMIMGYLYRDGAVVEKDLIKAWAYLDMAANKGVANAESSLQEIESKMAKTDLVKARALQRQWLRDWAFPQ